MAFLPDKYEKIKQQLTAANVTLIAVSKTKPIEDILAAYQHGIRDFGENYVQEMTEKYEALPKDIRWHFIGHLQSNKVKYIAPFVHLIHGTDSEKLLLEINRQGMKAGKTIRCLLQAYISKDKNKFGFDAQELKIIMAGIQDNPETYSHVSIDGLMGMASFTEDNDLIKTEFRHLRDLYNNLTLIHPGFSTLSMGMSADYMLAVEEGTNMVRIGSLLFGERNK